LPFSDLYNVLLRHSLRMQLELRHYFSLLVPATARHHQDFRNERRSILSQNLADLKVSNIELLRRISEYCFFSTSRCQFLTLFARIIVALTAEQIIIQKVC
jgi:hypothetical protein